METSHCLVDNHLVAATHKDSYGPVQQMDHRPKRVPGVPTYCELGQSSMTIILSLVVPNSISRTVPATPSFLESSSSKRGTMRPPVAMAISSISTPPTQRIAGMSEESMRPFHHHPRAEHTVLEEQVVGLVIKAPLTDGERGATVLDLGDHVGKVLLLLLG